MEKQMTLIHAAIPSTTYIHRENQQELIENGHEREPDMKLNTHIPSNLPCENSVFFTNASD